MRNGSDTNWNADDFLLDFPDIAWPGGELVEMPLELKIKKVGEHVANVLREGRQCLAVGAELGAAMLGLAVVDYMAGFRCGRKSTGADFKGFLEEYFPPLYTEHAAWIYEHLRCGLMHNLTAINPWQPRGAQFRITGKGDVHLEPAEGALVFQVHVFLIDVYRAWVMFQHHLVMRADRSGKEVHAFGRRFDRLGGAATIMAQE
jgi:hypothetical protein